MKKIQTILVTLAISALAALVTACFQPLDPPASGSLIGQVTLTVSNGAVARTILPTGDSHFSRYELVFSRDGFEDISISNASGIESEGLSLELEAGDWIVTVRAYRTYQINNTDQEYLAAHGSKPFTINPAQITPVQVDLAPIPVGTDASRGIFTYQVSFPTGAEGILTLGIYTAVLSDSGNAVSVEIDPGYYDLFISLTNAEGLSAWVSEKVHIYSGLESRAEFDFSTEDFTAAVYLAGTTVLPAGLAWQSIEGGTVTAYSGADYTSQLGSSLAGASWVIGVPASSAGSPIYLKAEVYGPGGRLYTATGDSDGAPGEAGVWGIVLNLADSTPPAEAGGFAGVPGDEQVTLFWTDPTDVDLSHIEITWAPSGTGTVTVAKGIQTYTVTSLTNEVAYAFTIEAVDTEGNKSTGITKTLVPPGLNNITDTAAYLATAPGGTSAANPIPLPVSINLADTGGSGWGYLLSVIAVTQKYVALDLSASAMQGTEFDPGTDNTGKDQIVSLVLPDAALSIKAGDGNNSGFNNLESVSGGNVVTIGQYAFRGCTALVELNFPKVETIGEGAFYDCTAMVYLAGTAVLPTGLGWENIEGGTVTAYSGADYTGQLGSSSAGASWVIGVPVSSAGSSIYLKAEVYGPGGRLYTATGNLGGEAGIRGIILNLADNTPPAEVGGFAGVPGDGQVTLFWTDPADVDLSHIEITWAPGGTGAVTVAKGIQTYTVVTGLTNGVSYAFTVKAIDTEGNKSTGITKTLVPPGLNSIADVAAYLAAVPGGASAANPVPLPVSINLADTGGNGWNNLLGAIGAAEKYVALDLSGSAMQGTEFDPGTGSTGKDRIVSLVLPDATLNIRAGNGNNSGYNNLESVSGGNVVTIGQYAFRGCTALVEVNFPKVETIGNGAFYDCTALEEVTLGFTSISGSLNRIFTTLKKVNLPMATTIGDRTFEGYTTLVEVNLPMATTIGEYAFAGCTALEEVDFPMAITIGEGAFVDCTTLVEVNLPLATTIGSGEFLYNSSYGVFAGCTALVTVDFPEVTSIGYSTFKDCTALVEVDLPKVTTIAQDAFAGCIVLEEVNLLKVETIGPQAFIGCIILGEVDFPEATTIGGSAFVGCTALVEVNFPKAETIDSYAFRYTALGEVDFPEAITIGHSAFEDCTTLETVNLQIATTIGWYAFRNCTALVEVNLPKAVTIGDYAFRYTALVEVDFPEATTIGSIAFNGCTALEEVNLPKAETIGDRAFEGCTALVEVNLPKVETIGNDAFIGCTSLEEVNLPKAETIGNDVFYMCTALTTVDIPEATTIGSGAFEGCTALVEVNLPKVTSIGKMAFYITGGTTALTITLPIAAPSLEYIIVISDTYSKTVTIKTPAGRIGYDSTWENNFKSNFGVDSTITLIFEGDPNALVSVQFTGPQDENITLTGVDAATLSWAANTALTVSVSGSFTTCRWVLDDVELSETGSTLTLYAGNLAVKRHSLTVFVTKDGVKYAKRVTFIVAQ
jgi:hypothetical protein